MSDIFISYSKEDKAFAEDLYKELGLFEVRGFMDVSDVSSGSDISARIKDTIRLSSAVVVVLSAAAQKSNWVMLELGLAESLGKTIIPVLAPRSNYEDAIPESLLDRVAIVADQNAIQQVAAKIVATATGTSVEESLEKTVSRARVRQRRLFITSAALAVLSVMSLALASFGGYLYRQIAQANMEVEAETLVAVEARNFAEMARRKTEETLTRLQQLTSGNTSFAISPDGRIIAVSNESGTVQILDGIKVVATLAVKQQVSSLAFSPNGASIAIGLWDSTIELYDLSTSSIMFILRGHEDAVTDVAFSPDATKLYSRSLDGALKTWDAATGELLSTMEF